MIKGLKGFSGVVAFVVVFMLVAGPAGAKTTIRVAYWWSGDTFRPALAEFMKEHPDIEVKEEQRPFGGFHEKMLVEAASGVGPDVYMVSIQNFGAIAKSGIFYPLDEFVRRDGLDLARFAPDPRSAYTYKDKVYAIQAWLSGGFTFLHVNQDLIDACGVDVPEYGMPGFDTWHWKDFLTATQKTTRMGPDGKIDREFATELVEVVQGKVNSKCQVECLAGVSEHVQSSSVGRGGKSCATWYSAQHNVDSACGRFFCCRND